MIATGYWLKIRQKNDDEALNTALVFNMPAGALAQMKTAARSGDCESAAKISRYYGYSKDDYEAEVAWQRMAAKCPDAQKKAELIYLLFYSDSEPAVAKEIDSLIFQVREIDKDRAEELVSLVEQRKKRMR
ncbi:hypothetical protein BN2497_13269 [Janthinobacterium sp. CG23_2]|nr:hypothetical protein BN2497_13269 [Janthinobacterium sp. CG23_2]CUU33032.1 hypothetical protein BN3177_13269 [Janthinobacterium sp. CG23_2]